MKSRYHCVHFLLGVLTIAVVYLVTQTRKTPVSVVPRESIADREDARHKIANNDTNVMGPPPWVKALKVPKSILNATNASLIPIEDVPVSLVGIISLPRSSSSFLAKSVLAGIPCHISVNELLFNNPHQERDAWPKDGSFLNLDPIPEKNSAAQLAQFVVRVAKRKCRDYLGESGHARACANHCWVNWKHFDNHLKHDYELHGQLWTLLRPFDLSLIVLERPVRDRWRSFWYATQKGDWNTRGDKVHKEGLANAKVPEIKPEFRKNHRTWYSFVQRFVHDSDSDFRWMDLTFDEVTNQDVNGIRQVLDEFVSTPNVPTV